MIEKFIEKKDFFESNGVKMSIQQDPFCCVLLTPLMQRAHNMQFSNEVVFVDSSGSCDQGGSSVTFIFGASKIGGVPLGCIIHNFQTEDAYELCFKQFRDLIGTDGFYGKEFPAVFMTDDSAAERNALNKVFPHSVLLLCTFHVMQAVWRWLWDSSHNIDKDHRRVLMLLFREVLYAQNEIDCELHKESLCENTIAKKYKLFLDYFSNLWQRRHEWCHCFRSKYRTRGHNTNNIVEVSIRIFKDQVLQRCKAFNATSLADFVCFSLEEFYKQKLISFANGRDMKLQHYFKKFCHKSRLLVVVKKTDTLFMVSSSQDSKFLYTVDVTLEHCDCPAGTGGTFCKHLCAVYNSGVNLITTPHLLFQDKIELASLALGNNDVNSSFFMSMDMNSNSLPEGRKDFNKPMQSVPNANNSNEPDGENNMDSSKESTQILVENCMDDNITTEYTAELKALEENLKKLQKFAEAHPSKYMLQNIRELNAKINNIENEQGFYDICSAVTNMKQGRRIKVQLTSIARRAERGLHAGTRAIQAGRPSNAEEPSKKNKKKRKRSLISNILANQPNAKSHGSAH